jgi:hypothetical protein
LGLYLIDNIAFDMQSSLKQTICLLLVLLLCQLPQQLHSFCGFFVAQAGAKLFNKTSQVIIARDGNNTVLTMANDFQGQVKDFAMVIPVPVVLRRQDVRIIDYKLFERFDAYSAPRLAEYYDSNPCENWEDMAYAADDWGGAEAAGMDDAGDMERNRQPKVKIEAQFDVEEYKIIILSATESKALEVWLKQNGYAIPDNAREVLEPYIKSNLKFFVVKVDAAKYAGQGFTQLRPLQIRYVSERFMLPIRLGMANAKDYQDLVVYALTRDGRAETVNYPIAKLPTDVEIPVAYRAPELFFDLYKKVYEYRWEKEGRNKVMLEYAWDVSMPQTMKCDPCASPPLELADLLMGGADWLLADANQPVFFTRLHARYTRALYPEDFFFQTTDNREHYQVRWVIHNAATGDLTCSEGKDYLKERRQREKQWAVNLAALQGKMDALPEDLRNLRPSEESLGKGAIPAFFPGGKDNNPNGGPQMPAGIWLPIGLLVLLLGVFFIQRRLGSAA